MAWSFVYLALCRLFKRTMEAADVLYGVTLGADGVSQIVSRRLAREETAVA